MSEYMQLALQQAQLALDIDEVPIGAVIVHNDTVIASAYNTRNSTRDATAHAEILAIQQACRAIGDWRLNECTMYVTLQPCLMCLGACYNARLDGIVFGAYDTNTGSRDTDSIANANTLNHTLTITGGVLEQQCSDMLKRYFAGKRAK